MAIKWRKNHEYSHPHHLQNKIWLYIGYIWKLIQLMMHIDAHKTLKGC